MKIYTTDRLDGTNGDVGSVETVAGAAGVLNDKRAIGLGINGLAGKGGGLFDALGIDRDQLAEGRQVCFPLPVTFGGRKRQALCQLLAEVDEEVTAINQGMIIFAAGHPQTDG